MNLLRRDFLQFISGLWVECDLRCHYILDAQNWIINPIHGTHLEHAAYVLGKIQEGHLYALRLCLKFRPVDQYTQ